MIDMQIFLPWQICATKLSGLGNLIKNVQVLSPKCELQVVFYYRLKIGTAGFSPKLRSQGSRRSPGNSTSFSCALGITESFGFA